jgi:hypothetical protein
MLGGGIIMNVKSQGGADLSSRKGELDSRRLKERQSSTKTREWRNCSLLLRIAIPLGSYLALSISEGAAQVTILPT